MFELKHEVICYVTIGVMGIFIIAVSVAINWSFTQKENVPISVAFNDIEALVKAEGEYVRIDSACLSDFYVIYQRQSEEREFHPFYDCSLAGPDSTHLFAIVEHEFGIISIEHWALESNEINYYEGKLEKVLGFHDRVQNILNENGIFYSDQLCFRLHVGETPARMKSKLISMSIVVFILAMMLSTLIFFYYKNRRRKRLLKQIKNDENPVDL